MRKLWIPAFVSIFIMIAGLTACKKEKGQAFTVRARYRETMHIFSNTDGMYNYHNANYSAAEAREPGTNSSISLYMAGTGADTFSIGPGYRNTLSVITEGVLYNSLAAGSHGDIVVSTIDIGDMQTAGSFSGVLYSLSNPSDSLPVTEGTFCLNYFFR
jgi:hypothetical protein